MKFNPQEVLFCPTTKCNLFCDHCTVKRSKKTLSLKSSIKFLKQCAKANIDRVGFSGGEPFLKINFLEKVIKEAVKQNMVFNNIMTNGVWFKNKKELITKLQRIERSGFDGRICLSVDAFHSQNLKKLTLFIKTAITVFKRNDIVSIASVYGAKNKNTYLLLKKLTKQLKGPKIKLIKINLEPIGKAKKLKNPWNATQWFKEDYCQGPGNVLFVLPNGDVKPCCGYANELDALTIGNINKNSLKTILKKAKANKLVQTIFKSGLTDIRNRLKACGVSFDGKTNDHCYFCHYILTKIPKDTLDKCLI
jgi:radical SAM protein with 4Fe4S-binding SPASM domain